MLQSLSMPKLSILHRHLWNDSSLPWKEEDLQIAIVETLRKMEKVAKFRVVADQNAGRRSKRHGAKLKIAGMVAGEPDLRVYLNDGRIGFIELKKSSGKLSPAQKQHHQLLKSLGHDVRVVKSGCPQDAINQVLKIMDEWL